MYIQTPNSYLTVYGQRIAYREAGTQHAGTPLVMLTHLAATLDEWDPKLIDLLSQDFHVIVMDLPGVGASEGQVGKTIASMAHQAIEIVSALGYAKINLLGLSMGGMIAQEIVRIRPELVQKLILAGTGHRGGLEIGKVTGKTFRFMLKGALHRVDPKRYIFYNHDAQGGKAAELVLDRMGQRQSSNRDEKMRVPQFLQQLKAIKLWGKDPEDSLAHITIPVLIVNGDNDQQVPTENSRIMHQRLSQSQLFIYSNAGHGAIFQWLFQIDPVVILPITEKDLARGSH